MLTGRRADRREQIIFADAECDHEIHPLDVLEELRGIFPADARLLQFFRLVAFPGGSSCR